jgi:hypothetical protein
MDGPLHADCALLTSRKVMQRRCIDLENEIRHGRARARGASVHGELPGAS